MIDVKYQRAKGGPCIWCGKSKKLMDVRFSDNSFVGTLCWGCNWKAVNMKTKDDPVPVPAKEVKP